MAGGNMGAQLSTVRRVGPFDEDHRLNAAEDRDWAYRALRADVPIVVAPEVVVRHVVWRDRAQRVQRCTEYGRSHGAFYSKHARHGDLFLATRAMLHVTHKVGDLVALRPPRAAERRTLARAFLGGMFTGFASGFQDLA
jgi:GT2 family glycosyltransferase